MLAPSPKSVKVYSLQSPDTKVTLRFKYSGDPSREHHEEAALISYVYTLTEARRPQPSIEPEKTIYKNLKPWKKLAIPNYVVVADGVSISGAPVVAWDGKKSLQGEAPWGHVVIGIVGDMTDGIYSVEVDASAVAVAEAQQEARKVKTIKVEEVVAPVVEVIAPEPTPEPVMVAGTAVVEEEEIPTPYTGDPFTVNADGHYVGDDGFVVPMDFDEFYERYPKYVLNWVKKRLNRFAVDVDVEDWTQDLLIHMKFLPVTSKHRTPGANGRTSGCSDVIETFNPLQQYGASERRFRNYINFCLANKFNTVQSKRQKNPVCRPGTVSFNSSDPYDANSEYTPMGDEYVHQNSEHLKALAEHREKQNDDRHFTNQFKDFVRREDPSVFPAIEALEATGPLAEAASYMGVTEQEFARYRARLKQLGECFISNAEVPKQRKPYKKRAAAGAEIKS